MHGNHAEGAFHEPGSAGIRAGVFPVIRTFMVPMHGKNGEGFPFGVPALTHPSRLKAGLRTDGTPPMGSWFQCMSP